MRSKMKKVKRFRKHHTPDEEPTKSELRKATKKAAKLQREWERDIKELRRSLSPYDDDDDE